MKGLSDVETRVLEHVSLPGINPAYNETFAAYPALLLRGLVRLDESNGHSILYITPLGRLILAAVKGQPV